MDPDFEDFFEDDDDEIIDFLNNIRTYTVRERPIHFNEWNNREFFDRFRFSKDTVQMILNQIRDHIPTIPRK